MNDKNKNGFGIFGAIAVGVAAVAAAVVVVTKKKKSKSKSYFKEELVKLPIFKKEEPPKKAAPGDEEDIFEDEEISTEEEKRSFFDEPEEVSYEEDEEFLSESHAKPIVKPVKPVAEEVTEEATAEEITEEAPAEEVTEEAPAEETVSEEVTEESDDDTFVFESVVVGKTDENEIESVSPENAVEPVSAESDRITPVMEVEEPDTDKIVEELSEQTEETAAEESVVEEAADDNTKVEENLADAIEETVRNSYNNGPVIDELIRAAMEEVTGKTSAEEASVNDTAGNVKAVEELQVEEIETADTGDGSEDKEEDDDDDIRPHESYYDWIYNVDEHYSVITDGTWVYCKSDDILTSTSVNKKGGRETIDIAETFKNRIKEDGYCLLKYIGTASEVVIPSTINGKPVVAAMNTFRSNQIIKKVTIPSTMRGLRRTFYSCYHLDKIIFEEGTQLVYELDSIMCGNNDMDSNTESTTVICSPEIAAYFRGHYKLGCPVLFDIK